MIAFLRPSWRRYPSHPRTDTVHTTNRDELRIWYRYSTKMATLLSAALLGDAFTVHDLAGCSMRTGWPQRREDPNPRDPSKKSVASRRVLVMSTRCEQYRY